MAKRRTKQDDDYEAETQLALVGSYSSTNDNKRKGKDIRIEGFVRKQKKVNGRHDTNR